MLDDQRRAPRRPLAANFQCELDLWISGTLAGQEVLPSQGSRITIEPVERTGGTADRSLVGFGVGPMRIPGSR